jgi:transposase
VLTPEERRARVAELFFDGRTTRQIYTELGVTRVAVEKDLRSIKAELTRRQSQPSDAALENEQRLLRIYAKAMEAFEHSRLTETVIRTEVTMEVDAEGKRKTVSEKAIKTVTPRVPDASFLSVAKSAIAELNRLRGLGPKSGGRSGPRLQDLPAESTAPEDAIELKLDFSTMTPKQREAFEVIKGFMGLGDTIDGQAVEVPAIEGHA